MTDYLIGIDVSSNNDSSWEDDDWDYCWVKATEGKSYKNPDYAHQIGVVRNRGKVLGHYHWLNDGTVQAQVDWFVDNADVRPGELIACDWEDPSDPTTAQKDEWITKVQALFPESGVIGVNKVGLYCNRDWWINHDTSSFFGDYLWIANYGGGADPGIQADWTFWQYTASPYDKNRGKFADLTALKAWAGADGTPEPPDPVSGGVWYSTDYLYPQVKPDPTNPNGVKKGDEVKVTASGGITARQLPGGPPTQGDDGENLVRPSGYTFDVTGDLVDGWVTGGTNWYSSDYLTKVTEPPPPAKPGWSSTPKVLAMSGVPGSVSYLQGVMHVEAVTTDDGTAYASCWIVAQDYENSGDTRFLLFNEAGQYQNWFQVNDGGHAQTFYAYRSAAGNLYVWVGEDSAYRHKWASGKKVSKTSGDKMDYKGARPQGGHKDRIVFRDATDTQETFYLFDRTDFTDGTNRTTPIKKCTLAKDTSPTQQGWGANADRIVRLRGSTNEDTEHNHDGLHRLDVYDWAGKALLRDMDITDMHRSGCTEDEPEGVAFANTNGTGILAAKREGSASASKRSYVLWTMTGLP